VTLLIARREELKRLNVTLGTEPQDRWMLVLKTDTASAQRAHLVAWLR
jgi:hypothetical protein